LTGETARDLGREEQNILKVLGSERFLKMQGLGNEVPFYIWAYPANQELTAQAAAKRIRNQLETKHGLDVPQIDLFALTVELLEQRKVLRRLIEVEPKRSREAFRRDLQKLLDPETHLVPAIKERLAQTPSYDVLLVVGVGQVFPFIRSHSLLNNLHAAVSGRPMLMLFPGEYRQSAALGSTLVLFDQLTDDQYYRAKNILEQEPS